MTAFWQSGTGQLPTGSPEAAFLKEFSIIPNNTTTVARINNFNNVTKENKYSGEVDKYLHINWKILEGDFINREVSQKIKCFSGTPESIDRNLNMLKLVMTICQFQPTHADAPTDDDLKKMIGKTAGIKIREYSIPKDDGSKPIEGNFVAEVHNPQGFESHTGVKLETIVKPIPYVSAMSRNPRNVNNDVFDDDVTF